MMYTNLIDMLDDMKKHNHRNFIRSDEPRNLIIGFECLNTHKIWRIRIGNIKNKIENCPEEVRKLITSIITKFDIDQTDLHNFLDNNDELDRFLKLKAFW